MSQLPPASYGAPAGVRPHRGTVILVLGILSWAVGCFVLGIIAWVMGNTDLKAMEAGYMDRSGEGLTKAGKIVGMIHVILSLLAIPLLIILFAVGALAAGHR